MSNNTKEEYRFSIGYYVFRDLGMTRQEFMDILEEI